jgi:hypothetical protein
VCGGLLPYVVVRSIASGALRLSLRRKFVDFHAMIVDGIEADEVVIRNPLPESRGTAYKLPLTVFLTHWLNRETGCGRAVVVLK